MSSKYTNPIDSIYWYIENGKIALVTTTVDDITDTIQTIDESLTDGLLIRYLADPVALDSAAADISAEELPINARLHKGIIDYIFHRLYLETSEPNTKLSDYHYTLFNRHIYANANGIESGNVDRMIPPKSTALRRS